MNDVPSLRHAYRVFLVPSALWSAVVVLEVAILVARALLHGFGQISEDSGGYMAIAEAYRATGAFHYEPGREFPYQFLVFLVSHVVEWSDRASLAAPIALLQVLVFHGVLSGFAVLLWRRVGRWATAILLALVIADWGDYKWIASVMSEAPAKIVSLAGLWFIASGVLIGRKVSFFGGLLLLGASPLMRPQDVAVPLAGIVGLAIYVWLTRRREGYRVGALSCVLLVGPTLVYLLAHGAATGVFGFSALSTNLLASRVLSLTDPDRLIAAGVDRLLVEAVVRPLYIGPPEVAARREAQVNDIGQPDGVYRTVYPMPYDEAAQLASAYLGGAERGPTGYGAARLLANLTRKAIAADPEPVFRSTFSIAAQYLVVPVERIVKDHSVRNKLRLLFYVIVLAAPLYLVFRRRAASAEAWSFLAAALVFSPIFWVAGAAAQNYEMRYALHGWLIPALLALLSVCVVEAMPRRGAEDRQD